MHHGSRRGRGPGTQRKIRRANVGKVYSLPGLTATGKDLLTKGETEAVGGFRIGA
jgi:hypothetical protein